MHPDRRKMRIRVQRLRERGGHQKLLHPIAGNMAEGIAPWAASLADGQQRPCAVQLFGATRSLRHWLVGSGDQSRSYGLGKRRNAAHGSDRDSCVDVMKLPFYRLRLTT